VAFFFDRGDYEPQMFPFVALSWKNFISGVVRGSAKQSVCRHESREEGCGNRSALWRRARRARAEEEFGSADYSAP